MIIYIVDIIGVLVFKLKNNSPVAADFDSPISFSLATEWM